MNFEFINELRLLLKDNNVFMFLITGGKTLALVLLSFKFFDGVIGNIGEDNQKLNNLPKFVAYAFFIVSSDWIVEIIENSFSVIDIAMGSTSNTLYTQLNDSLIQEWNNTMAGCEDWMDYTGVIMSSLFFVIFYIIAVLLMAICKIADLSMTCGYLLSRVFIIELMKVIFPLIIALSTLDFTKDLLGRWIKKYIGLFILGLGYIGIIHFTELVQKALINQFTVNDANGLNSGSSLGIFTFGMIVTIIVVFTLKVKLFQQVTSFISNFFA
ncbi:hypothetical protein [Flavobacterium psychrophilum]|uniref:hypothetical protein n=1 Tax=Flavobacterium psychrophilum TaxID=96345 RepID=UPI00106B8095|nr:hypothetical protein [Flavobacterium psychrophilum]